jgi:hypothetical protein
MNKLYASDALEASAVAAAAPCYIDEIIATNTSADTVMYLHIFDSATVPADTTDPDICIAVPFTGTVSYDPGKARGSRGAKFDAGCSICLSSTAVPKTVAGAIGAFTVRGKLVV